MTDHGKVERSSALTSYISWHFVCVTLFADWLSIRSRCPVQLCAVAKINIPNVKSEREGGCGAEALTLLW